MDMGFNTRPAPQQQLAPARLTTAPERQVAPTELQPEKAVQSAPDAVAIRFEKSQRLQSQSEIDAAIERELRRKVEQDAETNEFVYKSVDAVTGEVVQQFPSEVIMQIRAYNKAVLDAPAGPDGEIDVRRVQRVA
jgi:uncharacterized FlaG/YvyC family protein